MTELEKARAGRALALELHAASSAAHLETLRELHDARRLADMHHEVIALHREEVTAAGRVIDAARALAAAVYDQPEPTKTVMDAAADLAAALAAFDEARAGSPGSPRRAQVAEPVDVLPAPKLEQEHTMPAESYTPDPAPVEYDPKMHDLPPVLNVHKAALQEIDRVVGNELTLGESETARLRAVLSAALSEEHTRG